MRTIALLAAIGLSLQAQEWKYAKVTSPFTLPAGMNLGECPGVAVNSKGNVLIFTRTKNALAEFAPDGKFIRVLATSDLLPNPHGLRIDRQDNIWVTDLDAHVVLKLDPNGRVLMTLGKNKGMGEFIAGFPHIPLFNKPSDIAWNSKGDLFVTDGYGNSRVVKFDKNGRYLKTWGQKGTGPGEFNLPHAVVIDAEDLVYIADRENARVQVFDSEGKFLRQWNNTGHPYGLAWSPDKHLVLSDARKERVVKMNRDGQILGAFGEHGKQLGQFMWPHWVAFGPGGEMYVAEILNWRVQRFDFK